MNDKLKPCPAGGGEAALEAERLAWRRRMKRHELALQTIAGIAGSESTLAFLERIGKTARDALKEGGIE